MVKRVAIGVMHLAPYREKVLARVRSAAGFEVEEFSNLKVDGGHAWAGFGEAVEPLYRGNGLMALMRALGRYVFTRRYALVCWSAYHPYWLTIPQMVSAALGKRYAVALDTVSEEGGTLARMIKRYIFKRARFLWVPGAASRRFLERRYGIESERIVEGVYALEDARKAQGTGGLVFLTVCNNVAHRRVGVVVEGFERLLKEHPEARMVLCGKGMEEFCGAANTEVIEGCRWEELEGIYERADVYVHNGTEQFSTAVLMASIKEMPIVVGREVGIARDLFEGEAKPGIEVESWESAEAWEAAFSEIAKRREQWAAMGKTGREMAGKFEVGRVAESVAKKIREVI